MKWFCTFPNGLFLVGLGVGLLGGVLIGSLLFRQPPSVPVSELKPRDLQVGITTIAEFKEQIYDHVVSGSALGAPRSDPAEPYLVQHIEGKMYFFNTDEKFLGILPEPRGDELDDPFEYFRKSEVAFRVREMLSTR